MNGLRKQKIHAVEQGYQHLEIGVIIRQLLHARSTGSKSTPTYTISNKYIVFMCFFRIAFQIGTI